MWWMNGWMGSWMDETECKTPLFQVSIGFDPNNNTESVWLHLSQSGPSWHCNFYPIRFVFFFSSSVRSDEDHAWTPFSSPAADPPLRLDQSFDSSALWVASRKLRAISISSYIQSFHLKLVLNLKTIPRWRQCTQGSHMVPGMVKWYLG